MNNIIKNNGLVAGSPTNDYCDLQCVPGALTVLLEDEQHTGEDLHDLGQHHSWGGQVPRALGLQGAGVPHGEHQGGGLEHQHAQGEVFEPGGSHVHWESGHRKGESDDINIRCRLLELWLLLGGKHRGRQKQILLTEQTLVRTKVAYRKHLAVLPFLQWRNFTDVDIRLFIKQSPRGLNLGTQTRYWGSTQLSKQQHFKS